MLQEAKALECCVVFFGVFFFFSPECNCLAQLLPNAVKGGGRCMLDA